MANMKTAVAAENEILKSADFTYGYDAVMSNIAVVMQSILSGSGYNFVIGGKVEPYSNGGLNVKIAPLYAFCADTGACVAETLVTQPVSFEEADSSLDRVDILEVRAKEETFDRQNRKINNPATGVKYGVKMDTKKKIALDVKVKKGSNGSAVAPSADSGYVKLAEVIIPAGINNITSEFIKNVDARKGGVANTEWTAEKGSTFNPGYLAEIFFDFLVSHNEDGTHKNAVIKKQNIDFGTGAVQVKGSDIPSGQSYTIKDVDFSSAQALTDVIFSLVQNVNGLYPYANDILSRYSLIPNVPVAASTGNINVATGGVMSVDGIAVTEGQLVFLKDQTDVKENGFWKVQAGAWKRYTGFTSAEPAAFTHKLVSVDSGQTNAGKIFYLPGDNYTIGTSELEFSVSNVAYSDMAGTLVLRDLKGNFKAATPVAEDDVAIKASVTTEKNERIAADNSITASVTTEKNARIAADNSITASLNSHTSNKSNPHGVTKTQLGLGNVDNLAASAFLTEFLQSAGTLILTVGGTTKRIDNIRADTVDGYHAGTAAGQLIPVTAYNVGATAGYIKLANGFMIQWTYNAGTASITNVTFPVAFQHIPAVTTSPLTDAENSKDWYPDLKNCTNTGFQYYSRKVGVTGYFNWIAIGI